MNNINIADETRKALDAFATHMGVEPTELAESAINSYLDWQREEIELTQSRIDKADQGAPTIAADEVWKQLGLTD